MARRKIAILVVCCAILTAGAIYYFGTTSPAVQTNRATLNSAPTAENKFFDRQQARKFIAKVPAEKQRYVIDLNARAFLPDEKAGVENSGLGTKYIQFFEHPTPEQRKQLETTGVELERFVTAYAWNARGTSEAFNAALKLPFVRAVASIDPHDKLQPAIVVDPTPAHAIAAGGLRYHVVCRAGTTAADLQRELPAAAVSEIHQSVFGPRFEIVTKDEAIGIAKLDRSIFVEYAAPPMAMRDATGDDQSNINDVRDVVPSIDGAGVNVAVLELGLASQHVDFKDRLTVVDPVPAFDTLQGDIDHCTAVVGQIGSNGVNKPAAKGVAPACNVFLYSINDAAFVTTDIQDAAAKGARISNHSYGPIGLSPSQYGSYETEAADWDASLKANNLIATFAGNEGGGRQFKHIDFFVGMKNGLCLEASNGQAHAPDANPPTSQSDGLASFGQSGPMNDGRVKPDLVALGAMTLDLGTNSTQFNQGTSFSTPLTSGVAALIFQRYKQVFTTEPTAALTKALLCNTAADLGLKGPDAAYGFGLVDAEAAISLINVQSGTNSTFFEGSVGNSTEQTYTFTVSNLSQMRVTLCWMDPAGNPSASKALVNDLDLELTPPGVGTTVFPYSLNPASPGNAATNTAANRADPIEQVIIDAPASGQWTARVKGFSIPSGSQPFALVANVGGNAPLTARIKPVPNGDAPYTANFSGEPSLGDIVSYAWDFGDSTTGTGRDVTHDYPNPGTFTVTLTVTDSSNATSSVSVTFMVFDPNPTAVLLGSPTTGEAPLEVSFTGAQSDGNIVRYDWNFGDGETDFGPESEITHTYTLPGVYTVTMKITTGANKTAEDTLQVTVNARQVSSFPTKASGKISSKGRVLETLNLTMNIPEFVNTPQQAREMVRDGIVEGREFVLRIGPVGQTADPLVTFLIDRRGTDTNRDRSFKLNLVKGQVDIKLRTSATVDLLERVYKPLGITSTTQGPLTVTMHVEISSNDAVYSANYTVLFTSSKGGGKIQSVKVNP